MEIIATILITCIAVVVIVATLIFSVTLFLILAATAAVSVLLVMGYGAWRRWRFVHGAVQREKQAGVIEGEYMEISTDDQQRKDRS